MRQDKIIYDIREGIRQHADDTAYTDRYIIQMVNTHRAEFIRRELNNLQRVTTSSVTQKLCVELEEVSAYDCGITDCKTVMRSKVKIPETIDSHLGSSILEVRSTDTSSRPFKFTTRRRATYALKGSFSKNALTTYMDNDYIYVIGNSDLHKLIKCISITGVFVDPTELENYKNCCGSEDSSEKCYDRNTMDYPIPAHLIRPIRDAIVQSLISSLQIKKDNINDSHDEY